MDNFMEYGWDDEIVNESGEYVLLPEGDYDFTVTGFERGRHNGSDKIPPCNKAIVTLTVWGAEDKTEITENILLCNKLEWKLSQFFLSLGLKKHGEPLKMNWNAIVGQKGKCHVYVNKYTDKNGEERKSNRIKKFYAYDENVTTVQPAIQQNTAPQSSGGWQAGKF